MLTHKSRLLVNKLTGSCPRRGVAYGNGSYRSGSYRSVCKGALMKLSVPSATATTSGLLDSYCVTVTHLLTRTMWHVHSS